MNRAGIAAVLLLAIGILAATASAELTTSLSMQLCNIVGNIRFVVGVLALALFMLGGSTYAVGHFLPVDNELRKSVVGWAQAMIVGGVLGMVLVLIAPNIVGIILSVNGNSAQGCFGTTLGSGTPLATTGGGGGGGGGGSPACGPPDSCWPSASCSLYTSDTCPTGQVCCVPQGQH